MAWIWQEGLVPFIGYKGVNLAARPPGGNPAETGSLTASSLPLFLLGEPGSETKSRAGSEVVFKKKARYTMDNTAYSHLAKLRFLKKEREKQYSYVQIICIW